MIDWRLSWREMARVAAQTGYAAIDLPRGGAVGEDVSAARDFLAGLGVRGGMYPLPDGDLESLKEAARFAAAIGCTGMSKALPASAEQPKSQTWKEWQARLRPAASVLRDHGLRLALEFLGPLELRRKYPHPFISKLSEALEFAAECGCGAGILLDSWHWHHSGGTAAEIAAAAVESIVHVHVADALAMPAQDVRDMERELPGDGVVDFAVFFSALHGIGYDLGVSPEVFSSKWKLVTATEGALAGLKATRRVMGC